jgi:cystathionine beta-synthase
MDLKILDDIVRVDDKECFLMTRDLVRLEGLFVGGSGGAAVSGAIKYARSSGRKEKILVLLPDAASKYLGKIFNDNWMRDNGFLDDEHSLGTVRDLLSGKTHGEVVSASPKDTVGTVISKLKAFGISQIPVVDDGQLSGLVHEVDLLRHLVEGKGSLESSIAGIIESEYATVTVDTKVELLKGVLNDARVAIVTDGTRPVGIISKIDLIDYLAKRAAV